MVHINYTWTIRLLIVNLLLWMRLLGAYIYRFSGESDNKIYIAISILVFLDMITYGVIAVGLWRSCKRLNYFLIPFLLLNIFLCITDEFGLWDAAALLLNLSTGVAYLFERKNLK